MIKPWVVPQAAKWTRAMILAQIKEGSAITIAKPSLNMYIGKTIGSLSHVAASIINLASHGEMSIAEIVHDDVCTEIDTRLINLLPSKIKFGPELIGERKGKFLNHFGYRKNVMNFFPQSLEDHAWIACALSYSSLGEAPCFDQRGGNIAGGIAGITQSGAIFRGSAVADTQGVIVTPTDALHVSLAANGAKDLIDTHECTITSFFNHKFFQQLNEESSV